MSFVPFGVDSSLKCFVLYLQKGGGGGGREGGRGIEGGGERERSEGQG